MYFNGALLAQDRDNVLQLTSVHDNDMEVYMF
jgi:hypothetical protein